MDGPARGFGRRAALLRRRARLADAVRAFFRARHYLEVETSCAVTAPGEEVHLRAFETRRENGDGTSDRLWLRTSPEFAMKRLVAAGAGPIFQLARVWRNGEAGPLHAPEFTMLEWYAPGSDLDALMDETEQLLRAVLPPTVRCRGVETRIDQAFERITVADAFRRYAGIDILLEPGDADALARRAGASRRGTAGAWQEDWEDLFFRLMLERVEPALGRERATFLSHWPAAQAALARRDPADGRVALRFELYVCGIELANAFDELTDPVEQRARFEADRCRRLALDVARPAQGKAAQDWPLDEAFLADLAHLPSCAGAALGFDRLAMLATGADDIGDVLFL